MKTFLIILGSALLGAIVFILAFKTIKLKIAFARQAQNLSDKELKEAVLDNIKCANHWRQPVESEFQADFQSD